jgi:serine/threonine protein kinase
MIFEARMVVDEKVLAKAIQYQLIEFLGEGLNSCVYKAIKSHNDFNISQSVAVKILKSKKLVSTWKSEISRVSAVRSINCVGYLGWEIIYNKPALVLEYIEGCTLEELLNGSSITSIELEEIISQAKNGLSDLKKAGLFHGDVNLHNIMIDTTGTVKLVDFGVYDSDGELFLTPKYADPTVLAGNSPTYESDCYSLRSVQIDILKNHKIVNVQGQPTAALAEKVRAVRTQKLKRLGMTQKLKVFSQTKWKFGEFSKVLVLCALVVSPLLSHGDQLLSGVSKRATLAIRTKNWTLIEIDGEQRGYAPVDLTVDGERKISIQWTSATSHGQSSLTLQNGQHIVLGDDFFGGSGHD